MPIEPIISRILRAIRRGGIAWIAGLSCIGCSQEPGDGLKKFPVRGSVRVNDQPAAGIVVTFHHQAGAGGNAARPIGRADEQGRFQLSTNGDADGAVEGPYAVTFFWPSDEGPLPTDLLGGRYNNPKRSKFRPTVEAKENDLGPFNLEADLKKSRASPPG